MPTSSRATLSSTKSYDSIAPSHISQGSRTTSQTRSFSDQSGVHGFPARANSIHLPTKLPPAPAGLSDVDLTTLIVDEQLKDVPIGYYVARLRELGAPLLLSATRTNIIMPPGPQLPDWIECRPPALSQSTLTAAPHISPSHLLAISSPDSPRTLLLPVHGLVFASRSPGLSILSSHPSLQHSSSNLPTSPSPSPSHLPVVPLSLPSSLAVPIIQAWIYLASPSLLLSSLLPKIPRPPPSLSSILNPPDPGPPDAAAMAESLSQVSSKVLLERVALVHGLWQDVVALEMADSELWETMGRAWAILVASLGIRERKKRETTRWSEGSGGDSEGL
ncbi:hypothetical protein P7C70_g723, partial [Phenoliferia sp. Uapishka_3]